MPSFFSRHMSRQKVMGGSMNSYNRADSSNISPQSSANVAGNDKNTMTTQTSSIYQESYDYDMSTSMRSNNSEDQQSKNSSHFLASSAPPPAVVVQPVDEWGYFVDFRSPETSLFHRKSFYG